MTCTEFIALLDDIIDGSIAAETRAEVEKHMHKCGHCEVVFNTTRKTIEIYRSHELYDLPAGPPRPPPRRHHGPMQKRLLNPLSIVRRRTCPPCGASAGLFNACVIATKHRGLTAGDVRHLHQETPCPPCCRYPQRWVGISRISSPHPPSVTTPPQLSPQNTV